MVKLPQDFETKNLIGYMKVGDCGYIVPWAMHVDRDGYCSISSKFTYQTMPTGTCSLRIQRVENGLIAFIYDMRTRDKYTWTGYGTSELYDGGIPVVGFDNNVLHGKYFKSNQIVEFIRDRLKQSN